MKTVQQGHCIGGPWDDKHFASVKKFITIFEPAPHNHDRGTETAEVLGAYEWDGDTTHWDWRPKNG